MKVSLHTTADPAAAHAAVFLPWLEKSAAAAWRDRRPTAVLVPFRTDAYFLKARALSAGLNLIGVHFLTPGELRDRLARHLGVAARVPLRERLHLLLAIAAARIAERHDNAATASVAAAPDHLLKAIDLLNAGGWKFAEAGPAPLRPVVAEFERLVASAGFQLMHDADRDLLAQARAAAPAFASLFVTGFSGLHWPLWPLLAAAVHSAESASVCLTDPRTEAEALDATWIGTWEETFGAAEPLAADAGPRPFVEVLQLPETKSEIARRQSEPANGVEFLVGFNTAEQARAIVAKALHFLADPACERLGILFPAAGALSRRTAELLAEHAVPHNDGLAHHAPGPLEDPAWPAWLDLQENPRIPSVLRFLRAHPTPENFFSGLPLAEIEDALPRVFNDLLIDDLAVVAEYLARHPRSRHADKLGAGLRALRFLPESASLAQFIAASDSIFRELGWPARAEELRRLADDWSRLSKVVAPRAAWLRWLRETLVSWRAERAEGGNHPYSRVHLLPYAQAESQSWSHLIVAGLNEGQWPPTHEETGFLGEEEIDALNRRVRALNTRAVRQGRQGEGHSTVEPGHALCLGPAQRRELALRSFLNTIESTTVAVAATASLYEESTPDRRLNPSDFFTRLYFCARGQAVSEDAMGALRTETSRWLTAGGLFQTIAIDPLTGQQTRVAFDARRDAKRPFGEYEFALRAPLPKPLRLTATQWESAFASPALVWMNRLLGVAGRDAGDETPWSLATGQWVHHWLHAISGSPEPGAFAPLPASPELHARVRHRAETFRDRVLAVLEKSGRAMPDWWLSTWQQALHLAEQLAQRVAEVEGRTHVATEWKLRDTAITLGNGAELHVNGRLDLILAAAPPGTSPLPDDAWIVDYKTGNRSPLSVKKLWLGDGLQLALYALALHQLGARGIGVSLLTPDLTLAKAQLTLADLEAQERLWQGLHAMQESGVFGMRGALRDEFSYRGDYPLATLAIDPEVLAEKWTQSHPAFAGDTGEESA